MNYCERRRQSVRKTEEEHVDYFLNIIDGDQVAQWYLVVWRPRTGTGAGSFVGGFPNIWIDSGFVNIPEDEWMN